MVSNLNKKINRDSPAQIFFQIGGIVFLVIILFLMLSDFKMYQRKKELKQEVILYQKKIEELKKSGQTLKDQIANAGNDEYLEKIAYEQGMVKTGEREVIFVSPQEDKKPVEEQKSFWDNFSAWLSGSWGWLKSKF